MAEQTAIIDTKGDRFYCRRVKNRGENGGYGVGNKHCRPFLTARLNGTLSVQRTAVAPWVSHESTDVLVIQRRSRRN